MNWVVRVPGAKAPQNIAQMTNEKTDKINTLKRLRNKNKWNVNTGTHIYIIMRAHPLRLPNLSVSYQGTSDLHKN